LIVKQARFQPGEPLDEELIAALRTQDQRESSVELTSGVVLRVWNIAWGYDARDTHAHVTTNVSPGAPDPDASVDVFNTDEVVKITDAESDTIVWLR
jgi:hypothetical protein